MSGLKGICPHCGAQYYGWALRNPIEPKCERCGNDLEISESGVHIRSHYSSFRTKTYRIDSNHIREEMKVNKVIK